MAKKVKLDILDIAIDEEIEQTAPEENKPEENILSRIKAFIRRPSVWITLASLVLLGSVGVGSVMFYDRQDVQRPTVKKKAVASGKPGVASGEKMAVFPGILVDMRDAKNKVSVAFFDIALEPENSQDVKMIRNHAGARTLIFEKK
jgi:hypothetical protein